MKRLKFSGIVLMLFCLFGACHSNDKNQEPETAEELMITNKEAAQIEENPSEVEPINEVEPKDETEPLDEVEPIDEVSQQHAFRQAHAIR